MRITNVRTLVGTRLHTRKDQWITDRYRSIKADIAVAEIETDDGNVGVGEACSYGNPLQIRDWVDWYAPSLIGSLIEDGSSSASLPRKCATSSTTRRTPNWKASHNARAERLP